MSFFTKCSKLGRGIPMSLVDAKYWYEKASDAGDMYTQNNIGVLLLSGGPCVPADPVKAAQVFRKGANEGHDSAQCSLGNCFENGQGV